jgi:hypothetical protein
VAIHEPAIKKKMALRLSSKGLAGRPNHPIIEPHMPGFEGLNKVSQGKTINI